MKLFKKSLFQNKFLERLFFKKKSLKSIANQSGQAMIEYVLILIISVTMLFLAKGLFTNLNNYMTQYIGGYFRCLMVQGELPALGVTEKDLSQHTTASYKCSVALKHTDVAASGSAGGGKNLGVATSISKPQGSTEATASSRGPTSSTTSASKKSAKKRTDNSSSGGGESDTKFSSSIDNRSGSHHSADAESLEENNIRSTPMVIQNDSKNFEKTRTITGKQADDIKKRTRGGGLNDKEFVSKSILIKEDDQRPGPRQSVFKPHERKVAATIEDKEEEFGFGYFLKWIMIAGIGIALFIFFGGQIMNYSNSDS